MVQDVHHVSLVHAHLELGRLWRPVAKVLEGNVRACHLHGVEVDVSFAGVACREDLKLLGP